jgi:phospholipid/cholesterol/gamma-HCH transport system ATP-binding protein
MTNEAAAVSFHEVSKTFDDHQVLKNVTFEVAQGEICCILGRSGTGKSVTLRLLMGLIKPDTGRIFMNHVEIQNLDSAQLVTVRKSVGFLFQYSALFDSMTVGENVAFPLRRHTTLTEDQIQTVVREKLASVGLDGDIDQMPLELSGGMRKRAGLARALALNPEILLVDEPSSGLDPITAGEIDALLLDLKSRGTTSMVVVTHNMTSARHIGDHLIVLKAGQIAAQGSVAEMDKSDIDVVRQFMSATEGS